MIKRLKVHGFKTLIDMDIHFNPLTILLGRNGAGKTAILDSLQAVGNFARGGPDRAFGPPPWSLSWLKTRGMGNISSVDFQLDLSIKSDDYTYSLSLSEQNSQTKVEEERLIRTKDRTPIAIFSKRSPPANGTILKPEGDDPHKKELQRISDHLKSVVSYELNPATIEHGVDAEHHYVGRDGFGVAGFLAHLQDEQSERFGKLQERLKNIRPETQSIDTWSSGDKVYWGLRDPGQERAFPAVHLSWGDRQLVGLLCVLYAAKPGSVIAVEEVDRGFHHSRYLDVLELLTEAAYDGIDGQEPMQVIMTTHSPSFVNKLEDRLSEIRSVMRFSQGGTIVKPIADLLREKLGTDRSTELPIGEIWEMGILEDMTMAPSG